MSITQNLSVNSFFGATPNAASERLTDSPWALLPPPGLLTHVCRA
ncbi:hypothetical protein ACS15_5366 [Ralstonia insidiosa]|uniref:Uncharacterized protein n=1 Tax=Ralstonia insidiosa TaxID=190721 RepID=A0AAC9BMG4_9RALS|nr:hypothetical protein ACS15_5366 [Ralstonia insidiosa]